MVFAEAALIIALDLASHALRTLIGRFQERVIEGEQMVRNRLSILHPLMRPVANMLIGCGISGANEGHPVGIHLTAHLPHEAGSFLPHQ